MSARVVAVDAAVVVVVVVVIVVIAVVFVVVVVVAIHVSASDLTSALGIVVGVNTMKATPFMSPVPVV